MLRKIAVVLLAGVLPPCYPRSINNPPLTIARAARPLPRRLNGGVAVLFAAAGTVLDFMPYRQDEDFYYLTGWNEPGAALLIQGPALQPAIIPPATIARFYSCLRVIVAPNYTPA